MNNIVTSGTFNYSLFSPTVQCLTKDKASLPRRQHSNDAGADLTSCETLQIYPGTQQLVDTGLAVKIPQSYAGFVVNRSSQGKRGIIIPHSIGIIDSDYRGNIKVLLHNTGDDIYQIIKFETRIAQLLIVPIQLVNFVDCWNDTERGTGGFGSTGT